MANTARKDGPGGSGGHETITGRNRAEEELLRTQFAMDQAVDAVYWIDPQAKILYTNHAASSMLGYTADEFLRMTVHDLNPNFPAEVWPGFWAESREKKVISLETVHLTKGRRLIPIDIRVVFLAYGGREFHCAFVRDITERKRVEEEQRRMRTLLSNVINTTPDLVFVKDQNLRTVLCNQAFAQAVGKEPADLIGRTDIENGWDPELVQGSPERGIQGYDTDDRNALNGQVVRNPQDVILLNGIARSFDTLKVPLRDEQGTITGVLGIARDVTDRKRMEDALEALVRGTGAVIGEDFFPVFVKELAAALKVKYAAVSEIQADHPVRAVVRAMWSGSDWACPFEYALAGSPCEVVVRDGAACYPSGVQRLFPRDTDLASLHAESYLGILLRDSSGTMLGHLFVVDDEALDDPTYAMSTLQVFASRASAELERLQAEEALRLSQERFQLAARASNDGIWDWNILTGEQYWSDHHLELFGLTPGEFIPTYDLWISLVHPDDAMWVREATRRHLEARAPYDIEVRVRMKDGSYRWFRDRGQAVWDDSGRPVRMVGSISDVTERRQAEETIWRANAELEQRVAERTKELAKINRALELEIVERKRVEDRLQRTQYAVDHAADQIFLIDQNGNFLDVNEAACRRLGYTKEELLTMAVMDIDPDFPREIWDSAWAGLRQSGRIRVESRHCSKSGEIYPVEVMANYLCHGGMELDCAFVRDISERKRAEAEIRESELRYKLVTEATFDAIALHDNGVLLEVNTGLERMFRYEPGELLGRSILDLITDASRDFVRLNMRNGVTGPYEAVGRRKDGTTFPGELVVRPYRYRGKEVRLVAGRDITERKQLELQLARHAEELERQVAERTAEIAKLEAQRSQTEKLAAVGQMAAAVAHEINNPIAGIRNAFTLVKQAVDPAHPHYEFVGMIDREITRVVSIVQNMYQLYRKEPSKADPVNLPLLLRDLEALFTKRLSQLSLTLVVTEGPLRRKLLVPQSDLLQVLMNLIQNAMDSSRKGGAIKLNVSQEVDRVRISVSDEGSGIPPDVLPHIFDPFFTTKTEKGQKGMGLGLSVSQSLVMAMGGRIEVQTESGAGSTFSVILPEPAVVDDASVQRNIIKEVLTHET